MLLLQASVPATWRTSRIAAATIAVIAGLEEAREETVGSAASATSAGGFHCGM
jgi:hypothetical protein